MVYARGVKLRHLPLLFTLFATLVYSSIACRESWTPTPEPVDRHAPAPNAQGAQSSVTIGVPALVAPGPTPGTWTPSSLVRVTSLGLSSTATSSDKVILVGSNDNTVPVSTTYTLSSFFGGQTLTNAGQIGFNLGAFAYFSVLRVAGSTAGLSFEIVGDDGNSSSTSDGGSVLVPPDGGFATATNQSLQIVQETASATSLAEIEATVEPPGTSAATAQAVQGVVGGVPVPVSGTVTIDGGVSTTVQLSATLNAVADQAATSTPTALAALAAGPNGILVRSSVDNDPASRIRVATNAANGVGVALAPGESFVFAVKNASDLLIYLQADSDGGAAIVFAEQS